MVFLENSHPSSSKGSAKQKTNKSGRVSAKQVHEESEENTVEGVTQSTGMQVSKMCPRTLLYQNNLCSYSDRR